MSFFEDIAAALDADGIESRVNDEVLFVPITSDLEIQFVEIDAVMPAANVYIVAADVDEEDEEFEAVLVSVAFSVDDAIETVASHIATDQVVTVLRDLLDGRDERVSDLEFEQDPDDPNVVSAGVAQDSQLRVLVEVIGGVPTAVVKFLTFDPASYWDDDDAWDVNGQGQDTEATAADDVELAESNDFSDELEEESPYARLTSDVPSEVLELGSYTDFDRLFDVLSLCADQAEDWESQMMPFDDGLDN